MPPGAKRETQVKEASALQSALIDFSSEEKKGPAGLNQRPTFIRMSRSCRLLFSRSSLSPRLNLGGRRSARRGHRLMQVHEPSTYISSFNLAPRIFLLHSTKPASTFVSRAHLQSRPLHRVLTLPPFCLPGALAAAQEARKPAPQAQASDLCIKQDTPAFLVHFFTD